MHVRDNNFLSRFSSSSNLSLRNFALYRRLVRSQDQADKQRGSMNRKLEGKEFERIVTSGARSETKFPRFERKKRKEEEEEAREQRGEGACSIDQSAISNAELLIGYRFIADGKSGTACYRVQIRRLNHVKRRCLTTMLPDQLAANESIHNAGRRNGSSTPVAVAASPSTNPSNSYEFVVCRIIGRDENDIGGKRRCLDSIQIFPRI